MNKFFKTKQKIVDSSGKEVPVYFLKCCLLGPAYDALDELTTRLKMRNNVATIHHIIMCYKGFLDQVEAIQENDGTAQLVKDEQIKTAPESKL